MASRQSRKAFRKSKGFSRVLIAILIGAIALASLAVFSLGSTNSSSRTHAMANQKRYKATRAIVVDKQTGQRRLPTQEEVDQAVSSLSVLANRPESLPQAPTAAGGVAVDLQGGFGGVMLSRPNEDGTWETRCVFTLAEGIQFLGLVEEIQ